MSAIIKRALHKDFPLKRVQYGKRGEVRQVLSQTDGQG
jgi:hypothetical protein